MAKDILAVILDNTITFILLFGAVWVVRLIFHKKLSAVVQYALWGVVILRLLLPIGIATPASPWNMVGSVPVMAQQAPQQTTAAIIDTGDAAGTNQAPSIYIPQVQAGSAPVEYTTANHSSQTDTSQPSTLQRSTPVVDWAAIVLYALLAGAIAKGSWQYGRYMKLKRRIRLCSTDAPPLIYDVLEHCKKQLNLNKDIKLVLLTDFPSPAVMGIRKPTLILPKSMGREINLEQLSHVLMHELTHIKRHDMPVILLLNLLNAIYWWNPFAWLCCRMARKDMETVCDNAVLKALGESNRRHYIETLIHFAGDGSAPQALAGVSLNDGKMNMQRRIQGMYKKRKTAKPVIAGIIILCAAMTFATFTTACAPGNAPNQPTAAAITYAVPEKWNEALELPVNNFKATIDAKVTMPNVKKYSTTQIKRIPFAQDEIDKLLQYFAGDKSKGFTWEEDKYMTDGTLSGTAELPTGDAGRFYLYNKEGVNRGSSFNFYGEPEQYTQKEKFGAIKLSEQDALGKAEKVLSDLKISYMAPVSIARYGHIDNKILTKTKLYTKGYYVQFARKTGDFPPFWFTGWHVVTDINATGYSFQEVITIYIDENGDVQQFGWSNPSQTGAVIHENVSLLPFAQIQEKARAAIRDKSNIESFAKAPQGSTYTIKNVQLELVPIQGPNNPAEAVLTPCWFFYNTDKPMDGNAVDYGEEGVGTYFLEVLVINAVDGSVVDRYFFTEWMTMPGIYNTDIGTTDTAL